jgi:propionyl-CoA carboxylase alpha chain
VALAKAVGYFSAGTVEFIVDGKRNFYFLEMNTRLQVEHPVTELTTGLDLVELMLRVAAGEKLPLSQAEVPLRGWAIESRLYAEDPYRNFLPSTGRLRRYRPPEESADADHAVRNDTGVFEGGEISLLYDPMIAKLCTWAPNRAAAIDGMAAALDAFEVEGVGNNLPFLSAVMQQTRFREGRLTTGYIAEEFPNGFIGVTLAPEIVREIAAVACCAAYRIAARGFDGIARPREYKAQRAWVALIGEQSWMFEVAEKGGDFWLDGTGGRTLVEMNWAPGNGLARARIDGVVRVLKLRRTASGFCVRYRGAVLDIKTLGPGVAGLWPLMPVKTPPDSSRYLLCPMPGQVVRIDVNAGDVVEDGQPLAIVEAMKMENVLKAEKRARVLRINVQPGAVLAVDEVIMEFEGV